jgi:hypothetical protein
MNPLENPPVFLKEVERAVKEKNISFFHEMREDLYGVYKKADKSEKEAILQDLLAVLTNMKEAELCILMYYLIKEREFGEVLGKNDELFLRLSRATQNIATQHNIPLEEIGDWLSMVS